MSQENVVQKKEKVAYLELLRIIASFLVIVNHTDTGIFMPRTPENKVWWISLAYFFVSKTAVPIFLMISGALLLGRVDGKEKHKKRIVRIVLDILLFSFLYYVYGSYKTGSVIDVPEFLKLVYQRNVTNAYWYLYLYLGILVMLPLLQRMSVGMNRQAYRYMLTFSVLFLGGMPILSYYWNGLAYYFMFREPMFSAWIGMLFLGYYLVYHVELKNLYAFLSTIVFTGGVAAQVFLTYVEYQKNPENYLFFDNRTLLTVTATAAALFYMARWLGDKVHGRVFWKVVTWLGGCSFGIYLFSDLFLDVYAMCYLELMMRMHVLKAVILYELMIFISGAALTAVLKHIPGVRKLM